MLKKNNIFGHYQTKDSSQHSQLAGKQWSEKSENLKWNISSQYNFFTKINEDESATKRSFRVAYLLAKQGNVYQL